MRPFPNKFDIRPEDFGDSEITVDDLALRSLSSLQNVRVRLDGEETLSEELALKVKEALRNEARAHPNHPNIDIRIDEKWIQLCMYVFFLFSTFLTTSYCSLSNNLLHDPMSTMTSMDATEFHPTLSMANMLIYLLFYSSFMCR